MALTVTHIRQAKTREKLYRMADEKGLSLEVSPNGGKRWRFRYRFHGKAKMISLGTWPEVSLKKARDRRDEARAMLADGIDPSGARKRQQAEAERQHERAFGNAVERWRQDHLSTKSPAHQKRVATILKNCLLPWLADRPVEELTAPELLRVLRHTVDRGRTNTAHRALGIARQVLGWSVAHGWAPGNVADSLKGILPPAPRKHFAAPTDPEAVAEILRALDGFQGGMVVGTALRVLPYVFVRPGELRTMRWEDVDLEAGEWCYTVGKTKTEHLVPLAPQVVALLAELHPLTGHLPGGWVYPGGRSPLRPMSEAALSAAYHRMGLNTQNEITPHGWRAVARTLLHERLDYPPEVIEHQLAHSVPDALGKAYNRTRFLEQRRRMMQAWGDYLDKLRAGAEVVKLPARH